MLRITVLTCREKGGAYGSGARQNSGIFSFMSYRYISGMPNSPSLPR